VAGDGHDRAGSVGREDIVRHPDRDALSGEDVPRERSRVDTGLLALRGGALDLGHVARGLDISLHLGTFGRRGDLGDERVLRRKDHERRAVDRVGTGREEADLLTGVAFDRERQLRAFRATDPVGLQHTDALGPVQALELQQLVRVLRDPVKPLRHLPLHHDRVAALAPSVDDLLVGQHCLVARAPVDRRISAVGEALFVELQEHPLIPAVVLGVARDDLAAPVDRGAHAIELVAHVRHVRFGPDSRMDLSVDRGVLSVDAEGVEAHREQDVMTAHT